MVPGKHRPGNLPEYTVEVNTSQSEPGKTLLVHAECMSPVNASKPKQTGSHISDLTACSLAGQKSS